MKRNKHIVAVIGSGNHMLEHLLNTSANVIASIEDDCLFHLITNVPTQDNNTKKY
jgi:hypothetical protein